MRRRVRFSKNRVMGGGLTFQAKGLGLVPFNNVGSSIVHGPSSIYSPMEDEAPGPPLIH